MEKQQLKKQIMPPATVKVDPYTFAEAKSYCEQNGVKIGWLYDNLMKQFLAQLQLKKAEA